MKTLSALILLLALAFVAEGSNCRVVQRQSYGHAVYQQQYHHAAQVVAYPAYSVGYAPDLTDIVKTLIEENKAMRQDLIQAIKAGVGPGVLPLRASAPHSGATVLQARCASCHDEPVAKAKGKGIVLFRGGVLIEEGNTDRIVSAITPDGSGEVLMPPGKKLEAQEERDVLRFLLVKSGPVEVKGK
jgi:hypothetical protein